MLGEEAREIAAVSADDLEAEVMALYRVIGSKMGKRVDALRAGGFE